MASGFFDSVALSNHNHTTIPGDGGQLANLSVSGTIQSSGQITAGAGLAITGTGSETIDASTATGLATYQLALACSFIGA